MNLDISRTTLGIAAGIAGTLFLSYCIYFDKKRRSDPEYKKKVRESKYTNFILYMCHTCGVCHHNYVIYFVCNFLPCAQREKLIFFFICRIHHSKLFFLFLLFCRSCVISTGRRKCRQRKIGNSGSRTELPNLNDHEAVQR